LIYPTSFRYPVLLKLWVQKVHIKNCEILQKLILVTVRVSCKIVACPEQLG